jgi:putative flippase GtrA
MPATLVDRLPPKVRSVSAELGKFLVVGGFCFVLDTLLSLLFHFTLDLGPTTSKALSTIIATGVSYVGNRLWSFSHRVDEESGHGRDVTTYAVINLAGLVLTVIPVDIAHYVLDETSALAFTLSGVVGTAIATVFRFWAYRRWVFDVEPELAERAALV